MKDKKCECSNYNEDNVDRIKSLMPNEKTIYELSELFKVFGDSTRTKILSCLEHGELCVCQIANICQMTKSAVSHQLRCLRQAKLVKPRKSGKEVFYSLDDDHVVEIFKCALLHINE